MKVGDAVCHEKNPEYGAGKIVSFQHKQGTILVKFENLKAHTYHIAWDLKPERK